MNNKKKDLLAIHIATILAGATGLFGKLITLNPVIIVLGRVLFSSFFLFIILKILKQNLKLKNKKQLLVLFLTGFLLAIHWVTFFHSIQISTVAIGLLSFSTFPIFTTFLEPIFFKEKLKIINIIIALITFAGVTLIIPDYDFSNNATKGVIFGVISGLTFSVLAILSRKLVKNISGMKIVFYQDFFVTIILFPFIFFIKPVFEPNDIILLIILGTVFTAISGTLFVKGLKTVNTQTASVITCLEPVYGIILAIFILSEIPSTRVLFGGIIIILAIIFQTIFNRTTTS